MKSRTITFNCDICGKPATQPKSTYDYSTKRGRKHSCSKLCSARARQEYREQHSATYKLTCPICGTVRTLTASQKHQVYCSREHANAARTYDVVRSYGVAHGPKYLYSDQIAPIHVIITSPEYKRSCLTLVPDYADIAK